MDITREKAIAIYNKAYECYCDGGYAEQIVDLIFEELGVTVDGK